MCGIAGYVTARPTVLAVDTLEAMLQPVRRRGPDDEGVCLIARSTGAVRSYRTRRTAAAAPVADHVEAEAGRWTHDLALFHTRYAVIDLSAAAHQPFAAADGSAIAAYHGEIYNHVELRRELERGGVRFRTTSDTEVLVEGYCRWGEALWARLNGFWAVALYDRTRGALVLSRDRFGVAPLYYRETPVGLYFASDIASLRGVAPGADPVPARVAAFIETGLRDFDDGTCFDGIRAFPPGVAAAVARGEARLTGAPRHRFWTYPDSRLSTRDLSFAEAVDRFREIFFDAVAVRLRADLSVAFELSGGLDSSSVVAAATALRGELRTYTITVPESDEEPYARAMRAGRSLDYRVLEAPEAAFGAEAVAFGALMGEPYHAPNTYTCYRMRCAMHADGVGVVLTGSGGDEVLAGYEYDFWPAARAELRNGGRRLQALACDVAMAVGTPARARGWMRAHGSWLLRGVRRHWAHPVAYLRGRTAPAVPSEPAARLLHDYPTLSFHEQSLYHFQVAHLPYYLRSNDQFTMALPVEHRFPFLDYRVVEFGLRLPPAYLFRRGWTKYLLRRAMEPWLPPSVTWRRDKMGFPFPLRRFLAAERERLVPFVDAARAWGVCAEGEDGYDALLREEPLRLWRICSTGVWLQTV